MKLIYKFPALMAGAFLVFLSVSLVNPVLAQCNESNAQSTSNRVAGHSNTGQSFTASCAGDIISVTIEWGTLPTAGSNSNDRVLNIYDGPLCTSPLLHTQVIPVSSIVVGNNTFVLTAPVSINAGEVNAWEISDAGQTGDAAHGVAWVSGGAYSGGNAWYSCSQLTSLDNNFDVQIGNPPPVPTLSQWGLILLCLVMVSLGVIAVRRKMKTAV